MRASRLINILTTLQASGRATATKLAEENDFFRNQRYLRAPGSETEKADQNGNYGNGDSHGDTSVCSGNGLN